MKEVEVMKPNIIRKIAKKKKTKQKEKKTRTAR